jgi:hypothetical protein
MIFKTHARERHALGGEMTMSTINWDIAERRLQTLLDRADSLLDRAVFLDGLANADYQCVMLQVTDGVVSFCERPIIAGVVSQLPSAASRQAALSQRERVLAEHTKVDDEIEKVLKHLALREPDDAGAS